MRKISLRLALVIATAVGCMVGASKAHALIVTAGCANTNLSCSLQELASGGSITIDGKLFGNWSVDDASTIPVSLFGITVSALDNLPASPELQFIGNGHLSTAGLDLIDLEIRFGVTVIDGLSAIVGGSLQIDEFSFGGANAGGFIGVSEDILGANGIDLIAESDVFVDNRSQSVALFDSRAFSAGNSLNATTNIIVTGDDGSDTANFKSFTQRFTLRSTPVPEPSTVLLLALGLAGLSPFGRRMSSTGARHPSEGSP